MEQLNKIININTRINLLLALAILAVYIGVFAITYLRMYGTMLDDFTARAEVVNDFVQARIDTDNLVSTDTREEGSYYAIQQELNEIRVLSNIQCLYTATTDADGQLIYVIDGQNRDDPGFRHPGTPIEAGLLENLRRCLQGGSVSSSGIVNMEWGNVYVAFWPVLNAEGQVSGAVGMEFNTDHIVHAVRQTGIYSFLISAVFAAVAIFLTGLILKRVSEPFYKKLAYNDFLTGLPNRLAFEHCIRDHEHVCPVPTGVTVVVFDLNDLKAINDTLGHSAGDTYIKQSALLIDQAFKPLGGAYRIGGDELAAVVTNRQPEAVTAALEALFSQEHYVYKHHRFNCSYGSAVFDPSLDKNLRDTFNRADATMYQQKQAYHKKGENETDGNIE